MKNKMLIILNIVLVIGVITLLIFVFNKKENCYNKINENKKYNITTFKIEDECKTNCEKTINVNNISYKVNVSNNNIKINEKNIISVPEDEMMWQFLQVSIINNNIIVLNQNGLSRWLDFYDLNGNLIYKINYFTDNNGRLFSFYDNEFKIDKEGNIEFEGTKHTQGASNFYITETGIINLCEQDINDNEIVSGIFSLKYNGDNNFSQITYKETTKVVKDIKKCD